MSGFSLTTLLTAVSLVFTGISASAADGDLPPELQGLGLYEDILPIGSDGTGGFRLRGALHASRALSRSSSRPCLKRRPLPPLIISPTRSRFSVTMLPKSPRILPATHWTTLPLPAIAANWI